VTLHAVSTSGLVVEVDCLASMFAIEQSHAVGELGDVVGLTDAIVQHTVRLPPPKTPDRVASVTPLSVRVPVCKTCSPMYGFKPFTMA